MDVTVEKIGRIAAACRGPGRELYRVVIQIVALHQRVARRRRAFLAETFHSMKGAACVIAQICLRRRTIPATESPLCQNPVRHARSPAFSPAR
ncbi:hypothetical protein [Burkholderia multivorans]|uniref:hypothetical protein n=1 Tax=Burkholderia multivorans TaxID=87883 RepID=UPI0015E42D57|nr:hypothetical protein [Burkholderia multivorans]